MTGLFVINDWLECLVPHVTAAHLSGMLVMSTMKKTGQVGGSSCRYVRCESEQLCVIEQMQSTQRELSTRKDDEANLQSSRQHRSQSHKSHGLKCYFNRIYMSDQAKES